MAGHDDDVIEAAPRPLGFGRPTAMAESRIPARNERRVAELVEAHYDFIWRFVRRLGVLEAEDATQKVFWVTSEKLADVRPGRERAYLVGVAGRVASEFRRATFRRRESTEEPLDPPSQQPNSDELVEQRRARALLDDLLEQLTPELREVFVLFELEELDSREIAALLEIPAGTVASRLRRAREAFNDEVARWQAMQKGAKP